MNNTFTTGESIIQDWIPLQRECFEDYEFTQEELSWLSSTPTPPIVTTRLSNSPKNFVRNVLLLLNSAEYSTYIFENYTVEIVYSEKQLPTLLDSYQTQRARASAKKFKVAASKAAEILKKSLGYERRCIIHQVRVSGSIHNLASNSETYKTITKLLKEENREQDFCGFNQYSGINPETEKWYICDNVPEGRDLALEIQQLYSEGELDPCEKCIPFDPEDKQLEIFCEKILKDKLLREIKRSHYCFTHSILESLFSYWRKNKAGPMCWEFDPKQELPLICNRSNLIYCNCSCESCILRK